MKFRFLVLLICVVTEPAILHAQEPTRAIVPADTITVASRTPITNVVAHGDEAKATPVIVPVALPTLKKPLGTVAREVRAAKFFQAEAKNGTKRLCHSDDAAFGDTYGWVQCAAWDQQ
jgi:hypothetical protein